MCVEGKAAGEKIIIKTIKTIFVIMISMIRTEYGGKVRLPLRPCRSVRVISGTFL